MTDPDQAARLARQLAELPDCEPPAGAWQRVEARLGAGRRVPVARFMLAAAAAAVLVALALLPTLRGGVPPVPPPDAAPLVDRELDARAATLTELLAALPDARAERASTGLATSLLEERIAVVDERLRRAAGAPRAASTDLKRQRLVLLDSLVRVKYAAAVAVSL
jgi:hypothetical protein